MKAIKSNMKDYISGTGYILYCRSCGAEFSGNKGDYFLLPENHIFYCSCGEEMKLVEKIVTVTYKE